MVQNKRRSILAELGNLLVTFQIEQNKRREVAAGLQAAKQEGPAANSTPEAQTTKRKGDCNSR